MQLPSLNFLLNPTLLELATRIWNIIQRFSQPHGMYEVVAYSATLELHDPQGKRATYHKQEKVRFLQDHVIAYQDQAWGDGEIFAEYKCSPGVAVDRYQEGNRWRVLISLRETKNKGDIETFHIERGIRDGFQQPTENFQTKIDHHTHHLTLKVIFPTQRYPKRVTLVEENKNRVREVGGEAFQTLPDGRQQVTWQTATPRLHELYGLRWEW